MTPPLANTPASGSQQAAQLSLRAAPPAECHDCKIKSEIKPSNLWGAHKMIGLIHGIGVLVENLGKMVGLIHRIGILVESLGKMYASGELHISRFMNSYVRTSFQNGESILAVS